MSSENNKNLKIGIDIRNIGKERTGDEVVFFELIKNFKKLFAEENFGLDKIKFKFFLFTDIMDRKTLEIIAERLGVTGNDKFKIISLKTPARGGKFVWNFWILPKYLRKNPVDIYHTQYITPFFVSQKIKIVTHIHDVSFKVYKQFIKWNDLFFLNILIPLSIRRSDKIIAVSEFTKTEIEKYYPRAKGKIEVVYNSVSLQITNPLVGGTELQMNERKFRKRSFFKKEKLRAKRTVSTEEVRPQVEFFKTKQVRKKYDLPEKYILYVGTLQPRKNVALLIEAFAEIKHKLPGFKLVIAGNKQAHNFDKKIDEAMKKYNLSKKEIVFTGFIDYENKMLVYSMAKVLVTPSFYEGFGITPLEAIGAGTPVLISDIPAHKEIYENSALYFDPQNLADLKNKLYTVCIDKKIRARLVNQGFSRAGFFSWKKSAKKMLRIYKSLS